MAYELTYSRDAYKAIAALPRSASRVDRKRIVNALRHLADNPYPVNPNTPRGAIGKLKGAPSQWRYRVSRRFRIVYEIHGQTVFVASIEDRKDVYRGL